MGLKHRLYVYGSKFQPGSLSPEFQTEHLTVSLPIYTWNINNYFKLNMSKADLLTNRSNQLLLQGLPSQLIATLTFQLLKPKKVESPLTFTLPSQPASHPSWNMASHIFKIYPKFGYFPPALLLPTGLSCHISVTWSTRLASCLLSLSLALAACYPPLIKPKRCFHGTSKPTTPPVWTFQWSHIFWSPNAISNIIVWFFYLTLPLLQYSEHYPPSGPFTGCFFCLPNHHRHLAWFISSGSVSKGIFANEPYLDHLVNTTPCSTQHSQPPLLCSLYLFHSS